VHDVDVLIPVRQPAPWLGEALSSIESQTCASWRGILVVHGEYEDLEAVLTGCRGDWTVVMAPVELNLAQVLNLGLEHCTAEFVARLDADDIALPARFERQVAELRRRPDVAVVGTTAYLIDSRGNALGHRGQGLGPDKMRAAMRWRNSIIHPSVMFRRESITELNGYNENASGCEDYEMWLRVLQHSQISSLNEPLVQYRIHHGQVSKHQTIRAAAWETVRRARIQTAQIHHESSAAASARHVAWEIKQIIRSVRAGGTQSIFPQSWNRTKVFGNLDYEGRR
jgi:hypothetical protein